MGRNKALIEIGGRSFLETSVGNLHNSPVVGRVTVVTGADGAAVGARAKFFGAEVVENAQYAEGIMTSLQAGIRALPPESQAVIVALVDVPFFQTETVTSLVHLSRLQSPSITAMLGRAFYGNEPGHPCVIGADHFDAILQQASSDQGAGFLFKTHPSAYRYDCMDPGVVADFDSPSTIETHVYGRGIHQNS